MASKIVTIDSFYSMSEYRIELLILDEGSQTEHGNKWFKLKYNIAEMQKLNLKTMVTFGGAFSNHIAAVAAFGKEFGFRTRGMIRGDEVSILSETLRTAKENGMDLKFLSRADYRKMREIRFDIELPADSYLLPEGGSNALAVKGCSEILPRESKSHDVICCPVGTGATLAGIIVAATENQKILGFSALNNGDFLETEVLRLLKDFDEMEGSCHSKKRNWQIVTDYHFGGYAAVNEEVFEFVRRFLILTGIQLDYIYNGKMMLAIEKMISGAALKHKSILCIHTGGTQGNCGILEKRIKIT